MRGCIIHLAAAMLTTSLVCGEVFLFPPVTRSELGKFLAWRPSLLLLHSLNAGEPPSSFRDMVSPEDYRSTKVVVFQLQSLAVMYSCSIRMIHWCSQPRLTMIFFHWSFSSPGVGVGLGAIANKL
ncbi:hypothetical protein BJX96DRAFT_161023 [Aspergillus floccosus]